MRFAQHGIIDHRDNIPGTFLKSVPEKLQRIIPDKQNGDNRREQTMTNSHSQKSYNPVTDSQSLQYTHNP